MPTGCLRLLYGHPPFGSPCGAGSTTQAKLARLLHAAASRDWNANQTGLSRFIAYTLTKKEGQATHHIISTNLACLLPLPYACLLLLLLLLLLHAPHDHGSQSSSLPLPSFLYQYRRISLQPGTHLTGCRTSFRVAKSFGPGPRSCVDHAHVQVTRCTSPLRTAAHSTHVT